MDGRRRFGFPIATPLAFLAVCVAALLCALFPLTGSPGPEAAQILALVGGPTLLLAAAARGAQRKERGFYGDLVVQLVLLFACVGAFVTVVTIAGWSRPSCAPGRGYLPFLFVALPSLGLSSVLGLWLGRLFGRAQVAVIAGVAFLFGYTGWLAIDWLLDPSFRVLSHLLLLIEGDLVRGRAVSPAAVAFRFATSLFAIGLALAGIASYPRTRRSGLSSGPSQSPTLYAASLAVLLLGIAVHLGASDELSPGRDELEETYTLERRRGPLVLHADPLAVTVVEADAVLAEGALWLHRLKERLGVEPSGDIHIWLHQGRGAMAHYTGAEHVHFALPARRELHISGTDVPHPTLGHELAHVLGREIAGGILGVPTRLGFLPNAGIIEGLAMAVTPELEATSGLTLREKAAALRRAGLAPDPRGLFGEYLSFFGFWRHPPGNAYVTAGAVVEAIAARHGTEGLAKLYREGSLAAAFDDDEDALERFLTEHEAQLDALELPGDAVAHMSRSFRRPSILDETCDPDAQEAADSIRAAARAGDFEKAERLAHDAEGASLTGGTLKVLADAALRLGEHTRALGYLVTRADIHDTDDLRERAARDEEAGDALWQSGRRREALARWERVPLEPLSPGDRRMVLSKRLLGRALLARPEGSPVASAALDFLLTAGRSTDLVPPMARLGEALGEASHGSAESPEVLTLARYLLARQYLTRGAVDLGLEGFLRVYQDREHLLPELEEQVLRGVAIAHGLRGDLAVAKRGFETIAASTTRGAVRVFMRDRAERVERMMEAERSGAEERRGDRWLLGLPGLVRL